MRLTRSASFYYALVSEVERGLAQFRDTPILLCWGMRDFVFSGRVLDEFRSHWPQAEVERYEDCGHYVLEDAGDQLTSRVQQFLRAHPLTPTS